MKRLFFCCFSAMILFTSCCKLKIQYSYGSYTLVDGNASGMIVTHIRHAYRPTDINFPFFVTVLKKFSSSNGIILTDIVLQQVAVRQLTIPFVVTTTDKKGHVLALADSVVLQRAY
jgi:hypothetical protein